MTRRAFRSRREARRQTECPRGNRARGRGSAPGGCRIRLQGLQWMSMRTILERADNGAYRVGSDGPKIASTGVSTAAARCIGPVSPVMNSGSRSSTAASNDEIDVGRQFRERDIPAAMRRARRRRPACRCVDPMSTTEAPRARASAAPTSAKRTGSHSLMRRPAAGWMPTRGAPCCGRADKLGRSAARFFRDVQSGRAKSTLCQRSALRCSSRMRARRAPSRCPRYARADRARSRRSARRRLRPTRTRRAGVLPTKRAADCCECRARN